MPITDIITEAQALATVQEDQFEAGLAKLVADLQAFAATLGTAPATLSSLVETFSDGTTKAYNVTAA